MMVIMIMSMKKMVRNVKQAVGKDGESLFLLIIMIVMIIIIMMKQAVGKDGESLLLLVARALGLQSR